MTDIISAMPDSLLYRILSFFPIKDAAATSILSKRWRPLWLSLLTLDFDDDTFPDYFSFRNSMYLVMHLRDKTLPLLSFHLKCGNNRYNCDPEKFKYASLLRYPINLPSCVLTSSTLVVLMLKRLRLNDLENIGLPSLKVLHLERVTFRHYENLLRLLSSCPILEDLETKALRIAPLSYAYPAEGEGEVKSLSNMIKADISNVLIKFHWLHNVELLRTELMKSPCPLNGTVMFHNLAQVELIFDSKKWLGKWKWLIKLLENCPKLQNLTIDEASIQNEIYVDEDWKEPEIVPECLLSHLRTCSLGDYKGIKCDFKFANYIMRNSRVLSTMTIQTICSIDTNARLLMLMDLSLCTRSSASCKLSFI